MLSDIHAQLKRAPHAVRNLALCSRCPVIGAGCDSILVALHSYWQGKRHGKAYPSRRDVDPLELGPVLPNIFLVEVLPGPTFRFRLAGTEVDDIHGRSLTGKTPADIATPEVARIEEEHYRAVLVSGQPRCDHHRLVGDDGKPWDYERVILPLASDGRRIDMLLCAIHRGKRIAA